jgi:hypothetical protein
MRMVMALVQPTLGHRPGTSVTKDHYLGADAVAEAERLLARATLAGPTQAPSEGSWRGPKPLPSEGDGRELEGKLVT